MVHALRTAVSIVERERQYSKSTGGKQQRWSTPRHMSFCAYTFLPKLPSVLVVEDTLKDARCAPSLHDRAPSRSPPACAPALSLACFPTYFACDGCGVFARPVPWLCQCWRLITTEAT